MDRLRRTGPRPPATRSRRGDVVEDAAPRSPGRAAPRGRRADGPRRPRDEGQHAHDGDGPGEPDDEGLRPARARRTGRGPARGPALLGEARSGSAAPRAPRPGRRAPPPGAEGRSSTPMRIPRRKVTAADPTRRRASPREGVAPGRRPQSRGEGRDGERLAVRPHGHEDELRRRAEPPLPRLAGSRRTSRARPASRSDPRSTSRRRHLDGLALVDGRLEVDRVDVGRHDRRPRVPQGHDRGRLVHQRERDAAEQGPARVRLPRHDDPRERDRRHRHGRDLGRGRGRSGRRRRDRAPGASALASARSRSAIRSSTASMPQDTRMNPSSKPSALRVARGDARMRHDRRVLDQALDAAERLGAREDADGREEGLRGGQAAADQHEREHPAEALHLALGERVLRVARQARPRHPLDLRVLREELGDVLGVRRVALHAHVERLQAAQHEEAVERARHAADRVLEEAEALGERVVAREHRAADDVAVAVQVLRRRVDDDVGAELEGALEVRRRNVLSTTISTPCALADLRDGGEVGELERRVRRRLDPDELRLLARSPSRRSSRRSCRTGVNDEAAALEHLVEDAERAAVDVVGVDDVVARVQECAAGSRSRRAPRRTRARAARPRGTRGSPRARRAWGCACGEYSKPLWTPGPPGRTSR